MAAMIVSPAFKRPKHKATSQGHLPPRLLCSIVVKRHMSMAPLTASRESNLPACHYQVHLQSRWGQRASSLLSLHLTSYTVWSPGSHSASVREKIYPTVLYSAGWFPVI